MKYIIIIILTTITAYINLYGQTYISPFIGFDIAKIENRADYTSSEYITIIENGYVIESPTIGLKLKHNISNTFYMSLSTSFCHKNVKAVRNNFTDIEGIKYNYFHNHVSVYFAMSNFYLGTGYSYNFINNLKYSYQIDGKQYKTTDKGIIFTLGKNINRFDIAVYYYKGLSTIDIKDFDLFLDPINSFGLTLGYSIKLLNKLNNDQNCPKF